MPSGRQEFFYRVRRLNRDSWRWTAAQKRAFNKIWFYLEQQELEESERQSHAGAANLKQS